LIACMVNWMESPVSPSEDQARRKRIAEIEAESDRLRTQIREGIWVSITCLVGAGLVIAMEVVDWTQNQPPFLPAILMALLVVLGVIALIEASRYRRDHVRVELLMAELDWLEGDSS
jgi:hypothetical protein